MMDPRNPDNDDLTRALACFWLPSLGSHKVIKHFLSLNGQLAAHILNLASVTETPTPFAANFG